MPELKTAPLGHIPIPYNFAYADATARTGATGLLPADVGKFARQLDNNTIWMLTDDSPVTWVQVGATVAGAGGTLADPLGHVQQTQAIVNAGTMTTFGASAVGLNGSAGTVNTSSGPFSTRTSAATLNADAGVVPNGGSMTNVQAQFKPVFYAKIRTGSPITELRTWIGMFSADPMASDTPSIHYLAFRFSTVAGDSNWQCVSDDGGGSPTVTDSSVAHSADSIYTLKIDASDPASVKFYIDGVLRATHTTNLPTTTQDMGWLAQVRNTGSTNNKIIGINRMVISTP